MKISSSLREVLVLLVIVSPPSSLPSEQSSSFFQFVSDFDQMNNFLSGLIGREVFF